MLRAFSSLLIRFIPRKRNPKPMMVRPQKERARRFWSQSSMPRKRAGITSHWMLKATSCAVMVVPMLAPKMMPMDCTRVRSPAFTKPMTITVLALEDWMTQVTAAPDRMATKRLAENTFRMERIRSPAELWRPSLMSFMP